jgi:hypothetical protein
LALPDGNSALAISVVCQQLATTILLVLSPLNSPFFAHSKMDFGYISVFLNGLLDIWLTQKQAPAFDGH